MTKRQPADESEWSLKSIFGAALAISIPIVATAFATSFAKKIEEVSTGESDDENTESDSNEPTFEDVSRGLLELIFLGTVLFNNKTYSLTGVKTDFDRAFVPRWTPTNPIKITDLTLLKFQAIDDEIAAATFVGEIYLLSTSLTYSYYEEYASGFKSKLLTLEDLPRQMLPVEDAAILLEAKDTLSSNLVMNSRLLIGPRPGTRAFVIASVVWHHSSRDQLSVSFYRMSEDEWIFSSDLITEDPWTGMSRKPLSIDSFIIDPFATITRDISSRLSESEVKELFSKTPPDLWDANMLYWGNDRPSSYSSNFNPELTNGERMTTGYRSYANFSSKNLLATNRIEFSGPRPSTAGSVKVHDPGEALKARVIAWMEKAKIQMETLTLQKKSEGVYRLTGTMMNNPYYVQQLFPGSEKLLQEDAFAMKRVYPRVRIQRILGFYVKPNSPTSDLGLVMSDASLSNDLIPAPLSVMTPNNSIAVANPIPSKAVIVPSSW